MITSALDDGYCTRVPDTKAFTDFSVDIQFAACGTVETSVACNDIILSTEVLTRTSWWKDADTSTRKALAKIIVTLTLKFKVYAAYGKSSKRLTSRALELDIDSTVR